MGMSETPPICEAEELNGLPFGRLGKRILYMVCDISKVATLYHNSKNPLVVCAGKNHMEAVIILRVNIYNIYTYITYVLHYCDVVFQFNIFKQHTFSSKLQLQTPPS